MFKTDHVRIARERCPYKDKEKAVFLLTILGILKIHTGEK